jgi:hypothetical protein
MSAGRTRFVHVLLSHAGGTVERSALDDLLTVAAPSVVILMLCILTLPLAHYLVAVPLLLRAGAKRAGGEIRWRWFDRIIQFVVVAVGLGLILILALTALVGISTPEYLRWMAFGAVLGTALTGVVGSLTTWRDWHDWLAHNDVAKTLTEPVRCVLSVQQGRIRGAEIGWSVAVLAAILAAVAHVTWARDFDLAVSAPLVCATTGLILVAVFHAIDHLTPLATTVRAFRDLIDVRGKPQKSPTLVALLADPTTAHTSKLVESRYDAFLRTADLRLHRMTRKRAEPVRSSQRAACKALLHNHVTPLRPDDRIEQALAPILIACVTGRLPSPDNGSADFELGESQPDWTDRRVVAAVGVAAVAVLAQIASIAPRIVEAIGPWCRESEVLARFARPWHAPRCVGVARRAPSMPALRRLAMHTP